MGKNLKLLELFAPCCVATYKYKLQAPEKNLTNPKTQIKTQFTPKIPINNIISLAKFKDGGAAMFLLHTKNQKKAIKGNKDTSPFDKIILRDPTLS